MNLLDSPLRAADTETAAAVKAATFSFLRSRAAVATQKYQFSALNGSPGSNRPMKNVAARVRNTFGQFKHPFVT